jgi:hypothetical protein
MGENAYVLGGASSLSNHKRRKVRNLPEENLKALQIKTAPLCKAGLFVYLAE